MRTLGIEAADTPAYISRLKDENFLDDARYARAFIAGHARKKWGSRQIQQALQQKGVDRQIIQLLLTEYGDEERIENARALAHKKWKQISKGTPAERKQKTIAYLLGKGYAMEHIRTAMQDLPPL